MTYLYSLIGDYLFPFLFMIELVETMLHFGSMFGVIYTGKKFNQSLVRFNFFIELVSLHFCFWHLNYGYMYYSMALHYIFHIISNFYSVIVHLDDFSEPMKGTEGEIAKWILRWDSPSHLLNVYSLALILGPVYSIVCSALVAVFLLKFPKNLVYLDLPTSKTN